MKLMLLPVQDCVCVVAPYPFRIEPLEDFDPMGDLDVTGRGDLWYARPLLFFTCSVCPTGHMGDGTSHKDLSLVFFSTFEPISLTPDSCMQRKGVPMLYERAASQVPSLYVCPVENVLGRVPLIPCYLNGNSVNTIPHNFRGKIPREAAADSRPDSGTGSRLFEMNMWMWRYGRPFLVKYLWIRCKTSISNGHSISKSSISKVTLDIVGPTLDIGVARIQMTMSYW